ncbi:MAG TPA: type II toxin-antitoxin system RelE/ParE family toxin [Tepidisphaeraceae bacterium]|jgi:hypothetical protein|nr:type II toxin-antitoxin system RelE/ParE family toxin [Tepidisphaeraceae bacterium]
MEEERLTACLIPEHSIDDTLGGSAYANMKELRGKTSGAVLRIAFAFDSERVAQVLCGGNKRGAGQKVFYKKLIDKAEKLYRAHLESLAAKKKGS